MPNLLDHIIAGLLLVVWPLVMSRCKVPRPEERLADYKLAVAVQWSHVALLVGVWVLGARSWEALGLGLNVGWGLATVLAVFLAIALYMVLQLRSVVRDPAVAQAFRRQFEGLEGLLPQTPAEVRWFRVLAITAGICEELMYRGFLILYLSTWMSPWVAAGVAGLAFGAAHLYQGPRFALPIVGVGMAMGALYLIGGSLWVPMILHAWGDLIQMKTARVALASAPEAEFAVEPEA
jgi:CAAX protease family protein